MDINYDHITQILNTRTPELIHDFPIRNSAVCIPFLDTPEGPAILFEVRSPHLSQPGDVCFPGGKAEEGESPLENALRELCEELLITPEQVELLGQSDSLLTGNLLVTPFAVRLKEYDFTFSRDEVAEVFTVPFSWFMTHEPRVYTLNYSPELTPDFPVDRIQGGAGYKWRPRREKVYFYFYEQRCIWGMTAKMLAAFIRSVQDL